MVAIQLLETCVQATSDLYLTSVAFFSELSLLRCILLRLELVKLQEAVWVGYFAAELLPKALQVQSLIPTTVVDFDSYERHRSVTLRVVHIVHGHVGCKSPVILVEKLLHLLLDIGFEHEFALFWYSGLRQLDLPVQHQSLPLQPDRL